MFYTEEAVLMIQNRYMNCIWRQNLIEQHIFKDIIGYENIHRDSQKDSLCKELSFDNLDWESFIDMYFTSLLENHHYHIDDFSDIYVVCDINNLFGIYCLMKNRNLIFVELCKHHFQNFSLYDVNLKFGGGSEELNLLQKKYSALTGEAGTVVKRYLVSDENKVVNELDEEIDFRNGFFNLADEYKVEICNVFGLKNNFSWDNCSLLLLNSSGYSLPKTKLNWKQHYLPYFLMADYYFNKNNILLIKDHPLTPEGFLEELFPEKENILNGDIPIEFYALQEGFHIQRLLSAQSTGGDKIRDLADEADMLGDCYLYNFRLLHKLFTTFSMCGKDTSYSHFHYYGINRELLIKFKKYVFAPYPTGDPRGISTTILKGNIFTIIDTIPSEEEENIGAALRNADMETQIVFLDSAGIGNFISYDDMDLYKYIIPVVIHKTALREQTLSDFTDEYVYFFCKNPKIRASLQNFKIERELYYTGIKITAKSMTEEMISIWKKDMLLKLQDRKIKSMDREIKNIKETMTNWRSHFTSLI